MQLIRKSTGLTQAKVVEKSGLSLSVLKKYETDVNQIGGGALLKLFSIEEYEKYSLWFLTGKSAPDMGQIAPGDSEPEEHEQQQALAQKEFDQQFMKKVEDSMLMFCHLGWFEPKFTKEDKIDFDTCSSLILKDVKPLLQKMPQQQRHLHLVDKTG